jgi:hypothetical protein
MKPETVGHGNDVVVIEDHTRDRKGLSLALNVIDHKTGLRRAIERTLTSGSSFNPNDITNAIIIALVMSNEEIGFPGHGSGTGAGSDLPGNSASTRKGTLTWIIDMREKMNEKEIR